MPMCGVRKVGWRRPKIAGTWIQQFWIHGGVARYVHLKLAEILHQLIGSICHYLQSFIHPRWCRISSINSMLLNSCWFWHILFFWNLFGRGIRFNSTPSILTTTYKKTHLKYFCRSFNMYSTISWHRTNLEPWHRSGYEPTRRKGFL